MNEPVQALKDSVGVSHQRLSGPGTSQSREPAASSSTGRLTQPAVFLFTLSGQKIAENRAATHMLALLGNSGHAEGCLALLPALENMCQTMRSFKSDCPRSSELPTLRQTEEIEGRHMLVTGVLLPLLLSGEPRHVLVTMQWATTTHRSTLSPPSRQLGISKREHEVIVYLNQGMTNKEIALQLNISTHTVKEYLKRIMTKTNRRTRAGILGRVMNLSAIAVKI